MVKNQREIIENIKYSNASDNKINKTITVAIILAIMLAIVRLTKLYN